MHGWRVPLVNMDTSNWEAPFSLAGLDEQYGEYECRDWCDDLLAGKRMLNCQFVHCADCTWCLHDAHIHQSPSPPPGHDGTGCRGGCGPHEDWEEEDDDWRRRRLAGEDWM